MAKKPAGVSWAESRLSRHPHDQFVLDLPLRWEAHPSAKFEYVDERPWAALTMRCPDPRRCRAAQGKAEGPMALVNLSFRGF